MNDAEQRDLPQDVQPEGGEVRRQNDGLHVFVQHCGERIADHVEKVGIICPCA